MRRPLVVLSLLPLLIPVAAVIGGGLVVTVLQSLGLLMYSYSYPDMLFAYRELFADDRFARSTLFSLMVAGASSSVAVVLGTFLAYRIWQLPTRYHGWTIVYKIPLILPHIAVGFIAVLLLSKTGILSSLAWQLGMIDSFAEFPELLYTSAGMDLITAYVYKETPFVMVMVYAVLCRFDRRLADTAAMLGASPGRVFFRLILPFLLPVIHTTFIILFVYTFGAFDLPFVLGDGYPGMIAIRIYDIFFQRELALRPVAMAMLVLVFFFSLLFIFAYLKMSSRLQRGVRKL